MCSTQYTYCGYVVLFTANNDLSHYFPSQYSQTPLTLRHSPRKLIYIPPPWYKRGTWVFVVLQYFRNILSLKDSLSCYLQGKENIMYMMLLGVVDIIQYGCPHGSHFGFYLKFKLIRKMRKLQIFFARVAKYNAIKHFAAFAGIL